MVQNPTMGCSKLVFLYVKQMMIKVHSSKLLDKFSAIKCSARNQNSVPQRNANCFGFDMPSSESKNNSNKGTKIVESKMLDTTIASFLYENALLFNVVDSESFAALVDECIELFLKIMR